MFNFEIHIEKLAKLNTHKENSKNKKINSKIFKTES